MPAAGRLAQGVTNTAVVAAQLDGRVIAPPGVRARRNHPRATAKRESLGQALANEQLLLAARRCVGLNAWRVRRILSIHSPVDSAPQQNCGALGCLTTHYAFPANHFGMYSPPA